jgi:hypothetical protein
MNTYVLFRRQSLKWNYKVILIFAPAVLANIVVPQPSHIILGRPKYYRALAPETQRTSESPALMPE